MLAEGIRQGSFEAVARQDGHIAVWLVIGLRLDEDEQPVVMLGLSNTPSGGNAGACRHDFVAAQSRSDDDQNLVGRTVVESHQPPFQQRPLLDRKHAGVVIHKLIGRSRVPPLRLQAAGQKQQQQNNIFAHQIFYSKSKFTCTGSSLPSGAVK